MSKPQKHFELPERKKDDDKPMTLEDVIGILMFFLALGALIHFLG